MRTFSGALRNWGRADPTAWPNSNGVASDFGGFRWNGAGAGMKPDGGQRRRPGLKDPQCSRIGEMQDLCPAKTRRFRTASHISFSFKRFAAAFGVGICGVYFRIRQKKLFSPAGGQYQPGAAAQISNRHRLVQYCKGLARSSSCNFINNK